MHREPHPIRLTVEDDLRRSRLTVFFRLLLALPHLVWLWIWASFASLFVVIAWFAALFTGRVPEGLHGFFAALVRYSTHVHAYLFLAANPFPGFLGNTPYPVDVEIAPRGRQRRLSVLFRLVLALPAILLTTMLTSAGGPFATAFTTAWFIGGIVVAVAFLGWFACLVLGRMPRGLRDLGAYALGYTAQAAGYLFLVTARYPDSHPDRLEPVQELPSHPVRIAATDDARRSRLTVFFRLLLAFPHFIWLTLWSVPAVLAAFVGWFVALAIGRLPHALHRFLAAFVRYQAHVSSFLYLVGNPFPGFTGAAGSYPVDLEVAGPERQRRLVTAFRLLLAFPAFALAGGYAGVLFVVSILGWFAALFTGRMPDGLAALGASSIRYGSQTYAYLFLLTDRYPHSAPALLPEPEPEPEELPSAVAA